ncbi:pfkB family carbohydrate kinase [Actinobaculum suis]|uniref:PfkB family carbohydrate kinase n=1 Tax=Actinobaculum suis TaxID=1657 RepID=A0A1G7BCE8_9ACTO|nr:PfkB family carbohydrate kinase [Actinobaculum suis]MDY5153582.1 PfkB family carbohydrate kinase [Actinobaculum suis]SDE24632.1 pfkB family carbohydrate kinase [Actinobaculum suis]
MSCLVLGAVYVDGLPNEQPQAHGAMFGVSLGLATFGRSVRFVTDLGNDEAGKLLRAQADAVGLELYLRPKRERTAPTPRFTPEIARESGLPALTLPEAPKEGARRLDLSLFDPQVLVLGGSAMHTEETATRALEWVDTARSSATIVYSPAISKGVRTNFDKARRQAEKLIRAADVVCVSAADLRQLYGISASTRTYNKLAQYWFSFGPAIVAIPLDNGECIIYSRAQGGVIIRPLPRTQNKTRSNNNTTNNTATNGILTNGTVANRTMANRAVANRTVANGTAATATAVATPSTATGPAPTTVMQSDDSHWEDSRTRGNAEFTAALIDALDRVSLLGASVRERLDEVSLSNIHAVGVFAATAAQLATEKPRGVFPTREEVSQSVTDAYI